MCVNVHNCQGLTFRIMFGKVPGFIRDEFIRWVYYGTNRLVFFDPEK